MIELRVYDVEFEDLRGLLRNYLSISTVTDEEYLSVFLSDSEAPFLTHIAEAIRVHINGSVGGYCRTLDAWVKL